MPRLTPFVCLVALAGCRPAEEVRTYEVPRAKEAPAPTTAEARTHYVDAAGPADRLLGALIAAPDGGFYSLKLSGPAAAVGELAPKFRELVETVRLTGNGTDPLAYTLPAGWKSKPAGRAMRLATLTTGSPGLEVGVFPAFRGSLLENVNRWRQQVGAPAVTEADLPTAAPELKPSK